MTDPWNLYIRHKEQKKSRREKANPHHDKYPQPITLASASWTPLQEGGVLQATLEGDEKKIAEAAYLMNIGRIAPEKDIQVIPEVSTPRAKLVLRMNLRSEEDALLKLEAARKKTSFSFNVTSIRAHVAFDETSPNPTTFTPKVYVYLGDDSEHLDRMAVARILENPWVTVAAPQPTAEDPEKPVVVRGKTLNNPDDAADAADALAARVTALLDLKPRKRSTVEMK